MPHLLLPEILTSRAGWAAGIASLAGAMSMVALAIPFLDHLPAYDEMYHVLAARGLLQTGQPVIADGLYTRGELFTWCVAGAFRVWGESLVAARIPSLLAGCLLVALIGAWTTRKAGLLSGLAAGGLLASTPMTIDLAVMARFYTFHALAITILLIAGYEALQPGIRARSRLCLIVAAGAALVVALSLQITTVVALGAAVLGWTSVVVVGSWTQVRQFVLSHLVGCILAAVAFALIGLLAIGKLGFLQIMGEAPKWAQGRADNPGYYLYVFVRELPLLFPLLPIAAMLAILKYRYLGIFCTVLIVSAFAVHSIAASKADRYIYYLLPFMSILWGCGVSLLVENLRELFGKSLPMGRSWAALLAIFIVGLVIAMSQEGRRAAQIIVRKADPAGVVSYYDEGNWGVAKEVLRDSWQHADAIIVSAGVKALYYLGDYDLELNSSVVAETDTGLEFGLDERTGRQVIGTEQSLANALSDHERAVVMVENKKLGQAAGVQSAVVARLDRDCFRVDAGAETLITAWKCER